MTQQQFRWFLLTIAGGLLAFVVVRRRQQFAAALPQPIIEQAERFVIPWTTLERNKTSVEAADQSAQDQSADEQDGEEEQDEGGVMRRKVSSTYRISFSSKRYGPLPEHLVGTYVEVEVRDGNLFVLHEGQPIANFELQS
jgi:hypothetical protein